MLLALVVATALEAATPQTVELRPAGNAGPPVSAARRSLSDVGRELREGRKATGGFSAVETTVPREPVDLRFVPWEEEEVRGEPDVVPEPQPPGVVSNETYGGWGGGGWAPVPPRRRPPHVSPHVSPGNRRPTHAAPRPAADPTAAPVHSGSTRSLGVPALPNAAPRIAPVSVGRRPG
jgi:hypothetical protein